ncbi:hypothetical protein A2U01_0087362, partial [Trifolium medium]|nr:hypothetical protein [Trifolium medium]
LHNKILKITFLAERPLASIGEQTAVRFGVSGELWRESASWSIYLAEASLSDHLKNNTVATSR